MMNTSDRRTLTLILLSASGLWLTWAGVVRPATDTANARRQELVSLEHATDQGGLRAVADEEIEQILNEAAAHSARLTELWEVTARPGDLYQLLTDHAGGLGLKIAGIQPSRAGAPQTVASGGHHTITVNQTAYRLEVTGSFGQLCDLVELLESRSGMSRVDSIEMRPIREGGESEHAVAAEITTRHFTAVRPQDERASLVSGRPVGGGS